MIADGWSMGVMVREIQALYRALAEGSAEGRPAALPELPIQYADFALWQRRELEQGSLRAGLDYWRGQLAGAPALLELPTDHPRPPVQGFAGGGCPFAVAAATGAALKALARQERTTLFGALLAAFAVLLHRYTGAGDLVVGSPIANRNREETEGLIGLFVNMLALRTRLAGEQTFRELLRPVQETVVGAYDHQDVPFEALLEELQPARAPSHSPLFQVVLVLQNAPVSALDLPGLELEASDVSTGTAKFDLMLSMAEAGSDLVGVMDYRRELFEPATVERLTGHLLALLDGIAAAPDRRIGDLPLLSAAERSELLHEGNGVAIPAAAAAEACLHRLFETQAARVPDAVAVVADHLALTYAELNRRADRLAGHLRRLGVFPESRVGLCSEVSPDLAVGVLGILKAGGAYVPLDPAWPRERLALVLEGVTAPVVVTSAGVAADLPDQAVRLPLDALLAESAAPPGPDLPASAAYVIHTSGSTGRPKGVVVPHRNVARLFTAAAAMSCREDEVWTLVHSYTFDFSVWELWGALLHGGRVVLVPREVVRSPAALLALLGDEQVTVLSQTPSAFQQLVRAGAGAKPLALRWVIFGGEALDLRSLAPWFDRRGDRSPRLVNLYGITETTVHATWRPLGAADLAPGLGSRIGQPLADLRLYLTDPRLELVPAGVPGEICVAGPGLARGYLGDPTLTALRFCPDPFGSVPGGRLYRSGDLARHRPGAAGWDLEYLGRIDHQVKVRGYRIEPGEIETALDRHPAVAASVVVARDAGPGERRLVAYFVPRAESPGIDDLHVFLQGHLPDYMVPSVFVGLDRLPLTPNGKLDRAALPVPGPERPDLETAYAAPRTDTEEVLAQIWAQVLGLDQVGVQDNFFVLGGDSILTLRVQALAQERGLHFSLPQLFARQTVAELAREIDGGVAGPLAAASAGPFALISPEDRRRLPAGIEDAYPLTAVQSGMLYHMRYAPDAIVYHNVYSYPLRGRCEPGAFQRAAQRVIDRHPILRTGFDLTSYAEPLQLVHETAVLEFGADDLSGLPAVEQDRILDAFVEQEKLHGFDVSRPPLVRLHLHRRDAESFNLTLTECHPIFDGWSLHSFFVEIFDGYLVLLDRGELPEVPPLQRSVRDFVALERSAAESPDVRLYWSEALAHSRPLALPRWGGAEPAPEGRIRIVHAHLPEAVQQGLKRLARSAAVPLKSVLLAAHLKVMGRIAGGDDVLTGLVSSGRPEGTDGDRILGLFFNAVPFRMRIPEGSWSDLIRATFEAERRMLPFRRYPLARLQQTHGGKRLYEVLFNYIHFHMLRGLFATGEVELQGDIRRWEETDMTLSTTFVQEPVGEMLRLLLRYDSTQIAPWQVEAWRRLYEHTLCAMAGSPQERHDLDGLLSAPERHQVLVEWAGESPAARPAACIHELFEAQADRTPDAVAAVSGEAALSYAALDARANRLARWLRRAGVGPEARVGIFMHRSLEMLVAMLGILKAGGAYVPLDPLYPRERLAFVLGEAEVPLLLTQGGLERELPAGEGPRALALDSGWEAVAGDSAGRLRSGVTDACAAYVLFTSGSTGFPKGVVVEHRQLASYLAGVVERLAPPAGAWFAMASTFAADLGNTAIFPALCGGGCLHVLSEECAADPALWGEYGSRRPFDVLKIVPSHLAALLSSPDAAAILPRERLVFGGEVLAGALVDRVRALAPDLRVFNHYGPTEATVGVTTCRAGEPDGQTLPAGAATVPLGRPIAGTRIHLVDARLVPVPLGVSGELCIGGASVARGYLARPAATAGRFIPDPFAAAPGSRLYRTGDQARWLPDGRIEFLGRMDDQVKIRGFRIELREIELALVRHPGVRETAVAVRQDREGERRLVAYVVAVGEAPPDSELRSFLRRRLPDYMLPAGFVWLEELPRTANGKLDRDVLPATGELGSWRPAHVAPRNELERAIAAVWQEVLGVDRVGIDDNFFDLGGHSLIMLRVHSRLRSLVAAELPMVTLFEYPTIGELAKHLSAVQTQETAAPRAPLPGNRADARHAALERRRRSREQERTV
ncbi:MAG TPA: amino acid adenylation domain-containing protein [Thermoanaerobaculia bacterium]|nr:amino acid adenylation domain-containing protein [Thermoanaerobaculia bacterium]